jgi:PAS domain S-box-containing protein
VNERLQELQTEIDALRRENAELRRADTERKRDEEVLRRENERVGSILSALDTGQSLVDPDMTIVWVNQKAREFFPEHEPVGRKCYRLYEGMSEQCEVCAARHVFATGEVARVEKYVPMRGRWYDIIAQPIKDASGQVIQTLESFTDITERKRAEEALQESEEKYRNLVELAPEPIAVHRQGIFVYVNPPCVTLFGAEKREDLVGKPTLQFVHPDDHDVVGGRIRRVADKGTTVPRIAERFVKLDGQVVDVEVVATPVVYENLPSVMVLFRDITERKRAEEAIMRHTEELIQLNRQLEEADREANLYLDILTHDIGNTENVSNLYADLLIESLEGEAARHAKNLQRSVQKSIEILGTVSTIRRIHRTTAGLKPMDLDAVIREVFEDFPGSTVRYDGVDCSVMADDLLSVVFDNLIGNAVKFGGPGVAIAIGTEEEGGFVRVTVDDTGPGVPDSEKNAIFHRYEQQKRGVGEGLGLYLVQILVERYGGRIWVDDRVPGRPEGGAAFRFMLRKA